ncbi:MAG: hypothetical protein ABIC95_06080 [archaeon]
MKRIGLFIILFVIIIISQSAMGNALSAQLKRTNPGIAQVKPAELIYDIVNTDTTHKIEGFILCRSPDDIKVTSTLGLASGSGAQYISEMFIMDKGPSQKAIYLTIESDYTGDFSTGCMFRYVPFKEDEDIRLYEKMNGEYIREKSDSIFRDLILQKTVPFISAAEADVYCPLGQSHCLSEDVVVPSYPKKVSWQYSLLIILSILTIFLLIISIIVRIKKEK